MGHLSTVSENKKEKKQIIEFSTPVYWLQKSAWRNACLGAPTNTDIIEF